VGGCILCVGDSEEHERGVGVGVNVTMMSDTPSIVGVVDLGGRRNFRTRVSVTKKNHELVCIR
jgi:hypothetical protein